MLYLYTTDHGSYRRFSIEEYDIFFVDKNNFDVSLQKWKETALGKEILKLIGCLKLKHVCVYLYSDFFAEAYKMRRACLTFLFKYAWCTYEVDRTGFSFGTLAFSETDNSTFVFTVGNCGSCEQLFRIKDCTDSPSVPFRFPRLTSWGLCYCCSAL